MPVHTLAWQEYLAGLGIRIENLEARMHGKRNAELVADLIGGDLSGEEVFNHGARKEQLWREMLLRDGIESFRIAGLDDFLARYASVPKAVASNAEPANIDFVLDRYGLRKHFPVAVSGFEVDRPKPFPDIYLKAAERLGARPEHTIVFEDSPTGLKAGVDAGMRVVGIQTTADDLPGAVLQVRDFSDPRLDEWLASQET